MRRLIFILGIFLFLQPFFIMTQVQAQDAAPAESQATINHELTQQKAIQQDALKSEKGFFYRLFDGVITCVKWALLVAFFIVVMLEIIILIFVLFTTILRGGIVGECILVAIFLGVAYIFFEVFHSIFKFGVGWSWGSAVSVFVGLTCLFRILKILKRY